MLVLVLVLVLVLGLVVPGLGKDSGKLVHGGEKKQGVGWIGSWGAALRVRFNYNHWLATSSTIKYNNRVGMKSNRMECWRLPCWRCSWLCFCLFLKRTSSIYIWFPPLWTLITGHLQWPRNIAAGHSGFIQWTQWEGSRRADCRQIRQIAFHCEENWQRGARWGGTCGRCSFSTALLQSWIWLHLYSCHDIRFSQPAGCRYIVFLFALPV